MSAPWKKCEHGYYAHSCDVWHSGVWLSALSMILAVVAFALALSTR